MNELRFANQKVIPGNGFSPHTGYTIFTAYDRLLERDVAVKMGGLPNTAHHSIRQEYEILKKLDHPNIIKVLDYGESEGIEFMVMEKHKLGGRRSRWRRQFAYMNTLQIRNWITDLLKALIYLQSKRLLHEDVEMANIVASTPSESILIDFGRVRQYDYAILDLVSWLHPKTNTRINAWVRELCGIGGKYKEEGAMVNFNIEGMITLELGKYL